MLGLACGLRWNARPLTWQRKCTKSISLALWDWSKQWCQAWKRGKAATSLTIVATLELWVHHSTLCTVQQNLPWRDSLKRSLQHYYILTSSKCRVSTFWWKRIMARGVGGGGVEKRNSHREISPSAPCQRRQVKLWAPPNLPKIKTSSPFFL